MSDEVKQNPQTPQTGSTLNARIFTMPEAYRHGKEVKLVEPIKEQKSVPLPTTPPLPPKLPVVLTKPVAKQNHKAIIIAGVIVLIALGVGGYLLFRSSQKQQPSSQTTQPTPTQPVSRPAVETPTVVEEPAPIKSETENPFATEVVPGKDSDSDGLTDMEETAIYGTNPNLPDTDADGFLDGNEVFHRYNPGGTAPGTLLEAGKVTLKQIEGTIKIAYPSVWQATDSPISFVSTTGETISIIRQMPLADWITAQGGQEQVIKTVSKAGYDLYLTQDKRHAFLVVGDVALEFRYELSSKTTIDYLQTFQMMLGSVQKTGI